MTSRKGMVCIAALALLAFVCHTAMGSDENDNHTTTHAITVNAASLPDFDGDGTVGFSDFVIFAGVFGARQGDEKYDARYDLNGDGEIGFSDFVIFAQNFGKEINVVSLEVFGVTVLTAIGQTAELMVTANRSDDSRQDVERALVEWTSSDAAVATVSEGVVTAAAGGNAIITASYEGRSTEVTVSVRISHGTEGTVRVLYVAPKDRPFRPEYSEGISNAIVDVQSWYRRQLGGLTFQIYNTTPEWCQMSGDSDYYSRGNAWEKVMEGVQHCAPVAWYSDFVWVLYVDVDEACDEPHETGAGWAGIAIVPGWDLRGLVNPGKYYACDKGPYAGPLGRWFGGLAHELAHALDVPHPPGCDAELPTCDFPALMWLGFTSYPDTYLRFDEKEILMRSPFITGEATPMDGSDVTEGLLVHGVVLDPSGAPVEGIRLSLVADTFWNWGETGQDGTFRIDVPEEASGPVVVSVHGGKAASCNWLGYHGPGGLTSWRDDAMQVAVGAADAAGVEVKLPFTPDVLCGRDRTISGTVLGPDGRPVEGVWVEAFGEEWRLTGPDGTFEFVVPERVFQTYLYIQTADGCGLGHYGPDGLFNLEEEVSVFEIGQVDLTDIEIRLPVSPDECQSE